MWVGDEPGAQAVRAVPGVLTGRRILACLGGGVESGAGGGFGDDVVDGAGGEPVVHWRVAFADRPAQRPGHRDPKVLVVAPGVEAGPVTIPSISTVTNKVLFARTLAGYAAGWGTDPQVSHKSVLQIGRGGR